MASSGKSDKKGREGGLRSVETSGNGRSEVQAMRQDQYCDWLFNTHDELADGVCGLVVHNEYLYSRNFLSLLAGVADVFPKVSEHSTKIEKCVQALTKTSLEDICLSSNRVLARLKSGKPKRILEFIFGMRLRPHSSQGTNSSTANGSLAGGSNNNTLSSPVKKSKSTLSSGAHTNFKDTPTSDNGSASNRYSVGDKRSSSKTSPPNPSP